MGNEDGMNQKTMAMRRYPSSVWSGGSIGDGDRGAHVLSDKSGQRDRHAVVVVAQDRIALGLMPYGQAVVRVETELRDRL